MSPDDERFARYRELQRYVGWADEDAGCLRAAAGLIGPHVAAIVDDFYETIERFEATRAVITGGPAQVDRLKRTLREWVRQLFSGCYDASYVARRWRAGWRHVEIGLGQSFAIVALARIRAGLVRALQEHWQGDPRALARTVRALDTLLDLDLALIEDAYQAGHRDRLQRAERLVTIGQVAGGVAHELRNPLNVVKTSVYYLLNAPGAPPEKAAEHLRRIDRHVGLADGVITALSSFARLQAPEVRPFPLADCVAEVLEADPPPPSVAVRLDLPAGLPRAVADARQVQVVLANLVRNARDAMPSGGTLTVAARADGAAVEVTVADTGPGIPAGALARVTEPLYTTKAQGLGLGLAIARAILDKNRGTLRVSSEPGRGSAFTVRLSAADPAAGPTGPAPADPRTGGGEEAP